MWFLHTTCLELATLIENFIINVSSTEIAVGWYPQNIILRNTEVQWPTNDQTNSSFFGQVFSHGGGILISPSVPIVWWCWSTGSKADNQFEELSL